MDLSFWWREADSRREGMSGDGVTRTSRKCVTGRCSALGVRTRQEGPRGHVGPGQSAPAPGVMSLEVLGGGGAFG